MSVDDFNLEDYETVLKKCESIVCWIKQLRFHSQQVDMCYYLIQDFPFHMPLSII